MKNNPNYTGLEIAIVGIACRFPGAGNWREYWYNLINKIEPTRFLSNEEPTESGVDERSIKNEKFIKSKLTLQNKDVFDSAFFDYTPHEAGLMNPMHRIFHECVWEALEDAGYNPDNTNGLIGLYAGAGDDLNWKVYSTMKSYQQGADDFTTARINDKDFLSTLLSYKLNLKGPSFTVNAGCSTSLVAIDLACKSVLLGETKIALAGGISIETRKQSGYLYNDAINSADGYCRAFDKDASGTVFGEGAGVIVLKRLADAINDGDQIYSVIKGGAINNDGSRKVGFAAPSVDGQVDCIRKAQKLAKAEPGTIGYVEAHGTGTKLGDSIEVEALNIAFDKKENKTCALGSVKTSIGHLDAAAGVAGLIKATLCLKYKQLPASLHFNQPNPEIDFAGGPFYVNSELQEWTPRGDYPLRAGVSSFGVGGTNAHVILEEAPKTKADDEGRKYKLLNLSAKTSNSLTRYIDSLKKFLIKEPAVNLSDMAYTLQVGRKHFSCRKSFLFHDKEELIALLDSDNIKTNLTINRKGKGSVVFMFPGVGSQYAGMGKGLYESELVFREEMDNGFSILKNLTGEDFKSVLFTQLPGEVNTIDKTIYTQPLIFLFEYALARLLMSSGVFPQLMIGHSIGDYVAACIAGVFSFEDALKLVVKRGELMSNLPHDSIISMALPSAEVTSPGMQDSIMAAFEAELEKVTFNKLQLPFISNLTGELINDEEYSSGTYWVRHLCESVQLLKGIKTALLQSKTAIFIEVGTGQSLTNLLKQYTCNHPVVSVSLIQPFEEKEDDAKYFTNALGKIWEHGGAVNWSNYYKNEKRKRISLPTYSFEAIRYPTEVEPFSNASLSSFTLMDKGDNKELKDCIYFPTWERSIPGFKDSEATKKSYLFFSFDKSFSDPLAVELLKNESAIVEVYLGDGYNKISMLQYIIDPTQENNFKELLNELEKDQIEVTDIIYSWGMGVDSSKIVLDENNKEINLVYFSLVKLIQSLLLKGILSKKRIYILTNSLHKVIGSEKVSYAQSLLLGLVNVLPQEYSLSCFNIDVDLSENPANYLEKLVEEINSNAKPERISAIRCKQKWVQRHHQNLMHFQRKESVIKQGGLYLITGGLGNIGFVLASYLAKNYGARLILTGRKEINEDTLDGSKAESSARLKYLKSINRDIRYFNVDVSNLEDLKKMVEETETTMGSIVGIIHAAGIVNQKFYELVENISAKNAMAIFTPKIKGIENIYEIYKSRNLDFVWLTSSISSVLGGLSFGSYSSSNLFLDHFLLSKSDELSNWKSVGLAELLFTDESDVRALNATEIAALFEWSLSIKESCVILESKEDLFKRIHQVYEVKKDVYLNDDTGMGAIISKHSRPILSTNLVEPETATEIRLKALFESFFGFEDIGVEDDFFELGGDSLKAMMLLKRIKKEFNINVTLKDFLQKASVRLMAAKIDETVLFKLDHEVLFQA